MLHQNTVYLFKYEVLHNNSIIICLSNEKNINEHVIIQCIINVKVH